MIAFEGEIWINANNILPQGILLVGDDGRIAAAGDDIIVPEGVLVKKFNSGEKILPGFVEPHCHLGLYEEISGRDKLNRKDCLISTDLMAWRGIRFSDIGLYESALTGGVTTACILPGSASLIGGLGSVIKTAGDQEVMIEANCLKIALGENVEKEHGLNRMAIADVLFKEFEAGDNKWIKEALTGRLKLRVHCHSKEDIILALDLKKRFNLDMVLEHATEAALVLDQVVASKTAVAIGPFFVGRPKLEMANLDRNLAGKLVSAGVETCFMTDYPSNPPEMLKTALLEVIKSGVEPMAAFEMATIGSARLLGIEGRVGSLEVGKDADIVIHSGSPFDYMDRIVEVYIKGEKVFWPDTY